MDINIGGYQAEDFTLSKWLLSDAIMFFVSGTFGTVFSYLSDISRRSGKAEKVARLQGKPQLSIAA